MNNNPRHYIINFLKEKGTLFIALFIIVLFILIFVVQEPEEKETKENCNINDTKIDYHSSGELFCEYYNGTYNSLFGRCEFFKEDVSFSCLTNKVNEKFSFSEHCEVLQ